MYRKILHMNGDPAPLVGHATIRVASAYSPFSFRPRKYEYRDHFRVPFLNLHSGLLKDNEYQF